MIPSWLGKETVPETRVATVALLDAWSELLGGRIIEPEDNLTDSEWLRWGCKQAKVLQDLTDEILMEDDGVRIWVGFPETSIGRMNAALAGAVSRLFRWKNQNL